MFFTQITMEAAEDPAFLDAMHRAHILGALVGVELVTADGLKDVYKNFNPAGDALVARLRAFKRHGVHVLGSFIFGLQSDRRETFDATVALAEEAELTFAQFVLLTPFPETIDFEKWAADERRAGEHVGGVPVTRHWLIPEDRRRRGSTHRIPRCRSRRFAWARSTHEPGFTGGDRSGDAPVSSSRALGASRALDRRCALHTFCRRGVGQRINQYNTATPTAKTAVPAVHVMKRRRTRCS